MNWSITDEDITNEDKSGVEGFIKRLEESFKNDGPPIEGFRFLKSGKEMFDITREIERECQKNDLTGKLYVGFQNVAKFDKEESRYKKITESGVNVVGFGTGTSDSVHSTGLQQWVDLEADTKRFENQWYLIAKDPVPIIFAGWEISDAGNFGIGGITSPGKEFKGFISGDVRLVEGALQHLEFVRRQSVPETEMSLMELAETLPYPIEKILVVADDGKNETLAKLLEATSKFASARSAAMILYDMSAISYLINPYPSSEYQKENSTVIEKNQLSVIGREYLSNQLSVCESLGVKAGAVIPTSHGFSHLSTWAEKESADLIVIPNSMVRPGLIDRLKGYTLNNLINSTVIPILVYSENGNARIWTKASIK